VLIKNYVATLPADASEEEKIYIFDFLALFLAVKYTVVELRGFGVR
jgi:hypothetical protein